MLLTVQRQCTSSTEPLPNYTLIEFVSARMAFGWNSSMKIGEFQCDFSKKNRLLIFFSKRWFNVEKKLLLLSHYFRSNPHYEQISKCQKERWRW